MSCRSPPGSPRRRHPGRRLFTGEISNRCRKSTFVGDLAGPAKSHDTVSATQTLVRQQVSKVRPEGFEPPTLGSEVLKGLNRTFTTLSEVLILQGVTVSQNFDNAATKCRFSSLVGGQNCPSVHRPKPSPDRLASPERAADVPRSGRGSLDGGGRASGDSSDTLPQHGHSPFG